MATASTKFEAIVTSNPVDFGYGPNIRPADHSDSALFDKYGRVDAKGTARNVLAEIEKHKRAMGEVYHRVAIRELSTKLFWTYGELVDFVHDLGYRRKLNGG